MGLTPAINPSRDHRKFLGTGHMGDIGANKAIAAGLTGAASIVLVWVLGQFGVTMPAEVAAAISMIGATAATYFVPHGGAA